MGLPYIVIPSQYYAELAKRFLKWYLTMFTECYILFTVKQTQNKEKKMETKFARIDSSQHETIKKASKDKGTTFQHLLNRIIRIGISAMRLGEKK
jgi:predicted AAA+ superfamily ATPase